MRKLIIIVIVALLVLANLVTPFKVEQVHIRLEPEVIFHVGSFGVTNTLLTAVLAGIILLVLGKLATRHLTDVPGPHSLQNFIEAAFEIVYGYVESFAGPKTSAFFPLLICLFLYILVSNWLTLLPGVGSLTIWNGEESVPLLRSATSDLNTTLSLAVISVLASQAFGVRFRGWWGHITRFIAIDRFVTFGRELIKGRHPSPSLLVHGLLDLFIGMLEIFEELTKVLSFGFRLFGNIFGGEVLLTVMAFLVPYVASLPFMGIEMLSGLIQAFIFCVLSAAFFARAATAHGQADEPADASAEGAALPETQQA